MRPVDGEFDQFPEGALDRVVGEDPERVAGDRAVMACALDGIAQRPVARHQVDGVLEVAWLLVEALECPAPELAFRFVAAQKGEDAAHKDFEGFPIPAAAGLIASLTLFMLWLDAGQKTIGPWKFALPPLMLFLSFLMFSRVRYPSFKAVNWRTRRSIPKFLAIIVVLIFTVMNYEWMPAMIFISYLLYGLARPLISQSWRKEIESEIGEDEEAAPENRGA